MGLTLTADASTDDRSSRVVGRSFSLDRFPKVGPGLPHRGHGIGAESSTVVGTSALLRLQRTSMAMLSVVSRLPGKDRMIAKVVEPIHKAATAIEFKEFLP
jgi:hypothetical protein